MTQMRPTYPASALIGQRRLDELDVLLVRRHVFPEGLTSADDAEVLLSIHRSASETTSDWDAWFVEAMVAFIVFHSWPQYSLDEFNANWIVASIAPEGVVATQAELEFLLHAIEVSRSVPDLLSALAIDQLRIAIEGGGALSFLRLSKRPGISREDVDYLYRILKGSFGGGRMRLTAREYAVIAAIEDRVRSHFNHPAWHDLLRSLEQVDDAGLRNASGWLQSFESVEESCVA
ncbi:hypothetical protein [Rhizobium alvei]|uniref:Uncharacterized protein n=1 Tax=Rhizobium alvei TaxID=1132659 RepID=A0ABT8YRB6_9HYPH|nr:hypothetical protein [Rhizobium alvei]MDO6965857.1 hypothetical protein [Rhizobium alvei]